MSALGILFNPFSLAALVVGWLLGIGIGIGFTTLWFRRKIKRIRNQAYQAVAPVKTEFRVDTVTIPPKESSVSRTYEDNNLPHNKKNQLACQLGQALLKQGLVEVTIDEVTPAGARFNGTVHYRYKLKVRTIPFI
jgi:hypothetical protein